MTTDKSTQHTPTPWHVNGIDSKRGRITGDETSEGWDKLHINAANVTVARFYRASDAAYCRQAVNAHEELVAALAEILAAIDQNRTDPGIGTRIRFANAEDAARAALAKVQEGGDK